MVNARIAVLGLFALMAGLPAKAWELDGARTLIAATRDGREIPIGTVTFTPEGERARVAVAIDRSKFTDYFLSMREFKCLEDPTEVTCYVPYPYANPGWVTKTDFAWLEHALLFLTKKPAEFGANLWNGLYFRMSLTDDGLIGEPRAVDLNQIAFPPDNLDVPPYGEADQGPVAEGAHWLTGLKIR